jgi:hypothetical protein
MDRKKLRERLARATPYILALLTAILLRLLVDNLYDTGRRFDVPLEARDLPANLRLVSGLPETVSVKLTGYKDALAGSDLESKLTAWVSLGRAVPGTNLIAVKIGDTGLPFNVNFHSVSPVRVSLILAASTNSGTAGTATAGTGTAGTGR